MNCVKPKSVCQYQLPCNPGECSANICQKTLDNIEESLNILIALQQPVNDLPDNITPSAKTSRKSSKS